jgi:hypothetical protein
VRDARRVAGVWDTARETFRDPKPPLGQRQQHDAAIRGDPAAVEGGCDFLAGDGWKGKRGGRIVQHGGRGWLEKAIKDWLRQANLFIQTLMLRSPPFQSTLRE